MIKPGVDIAGIQPEMMVALMEAQPLFAARNVKLVITSVKDGKHGKGSLHYVGLALDLRTRHLTPMQKSDIAAELRTALGEQFDVVEETDHLHVEFDPKGPSEFQPK